MQSLNRFLLIAICWAGTVAGPCPAQPVNSLVDRYADQFTPLTEASRATLRQQVRTELQHLDQALAQLDELTHLRLQRELKLDELHRELESPLDVRRLRTLERNFYGLADGLDREPVLQVRQALARYVGYLEVALHPDVKTEFLRRLKDLDKLTADPDSTDGLQVARHVEWLQNTGQVPELVAELQQQFRHPCIVVDVNMKLLAPRLAEYQRDISQSEFTSNRIVGVPVSGISHFTAQVTPELVENQERATLRLNVRGTIESPSNDSRPDSQRAPLIGNVSVALNTSGRTTVDGYKDIFWNGSRLVSEPAAVECQTDAELNNVAISRNYRFPQRRIARRVDSQIRKRAHEEVNKKSPAANREAAGIARRQVASQLDREIGQLLDEANSEIDEYYRKTLVSLGLFPAGSSQSGSESVRLGFRGPNFGGIGAPAEWDNRSIRGDVEVALHETVSTSVWAGYLRGRTIGDVDFKNIHRELRGFVPQALRMSGNSAWSATLDSQAPLEARFRDQRVTLTMRMDSLTLENETWNHPFMVSAQYRVVPEIDMPRFERDGDVIFQWTAGTPADAEATVRPFVIEKFDAFFARQMHMDGMSAPVGSTWGATAQMKIVASEIQGGWWRLIFKHRDLNLLK